MTLRERLVGIVAGLLDRCRHVAVEASSPIPAAGAMLLRACKEQEDETARIFLSFVVPRIIMFQGKHTKRVFVEAADVIGAAGTSPAGVVRTGGPHAIVTEVAPFSFDRAQGHFRLVSIHPGHTLAKMKDATGFSFDHAPRPATTPVPEPAVLALLRDRVRTEFAETYPDFAARLAGEAGTAPSVHAVS